MSAGVADKSGKMERTRAYLAQAAGEQRRHHRDSPEWKFWQRKIDILLDEYLRLRIR